MAGFELQTISIEVELLCHKRICLIRQNTFDVSHVSKCIRMVGSALMVSSRMFSAQVKTLKCTSVLTMLIVFSSHPYCSHTDNDN